MNLVPHPQNPNKHTDKQIALLAKVIKHTGWRSPIVVSKKSGFIVAGHGRLEAAKLLDVAQVPIEEQAFKNEADEFAHLVADNRIAELSNLSSSETFDILNKLKEDKFDLEITGYTYDEFEAMLELSKPLEHSDPNAPKDKTVEEWKEVYDNSTLRQIILMYDESEYDEVLGLIGRIRDLGEMETNTEAVTAAIRAYKVAS